MNPADLLNQPKVPMKTNEDPACEMSRVDKRSNRTSVERWTEFRQINIVVGIVGVVVAGMYTDKAQATGMLMR